MFKKLKDKLAEEVKSSPQRIQQFAQAAQAAVTSASSSISDITNSDLFSIGDNDTSKDRSSKATQLATNQPNMFQDVSLGQPVTNPGDYSHDIVENQRQRRLSNSSFTSDVSFRLPNYETPSMYHLQSDIEVSASEADERGFSGGQPTLDRVTKDQLYAAYKRTQERYTKYRTQYGDLARHYKLLERENAKARSVLVETQDKALRRISELKEQCTLEQSAKAHLEKTLRVELEEKILKIDALNTKVKLLQSHPKQFSEMDCKNENLNKPVTNAENDIQLINLFNDNVEKSMSDETSISEVSILNNKIEKMEQLLNKYKESLKSNKEKNSHMVTELQIVSNELEQKNKENGELNISAELLIDAKQKIQDLNNMNEELQNKINAFDFTKTKELSTLEIDLQKAQEEITELRGKIEVFSKKEEEYAISLAENKLSIHKELESKESEIKSLKDSLSASDNEILSLNIVVNEYKKSLSNLEEERSKLKNDLNELGVTKAKMIEVELQLQELMKRNQNFENVITKSSEEYKCLQLQMKQETAEKLAIIDRNDYLENRNKQLTDENMKKSSQINNLESELNINKYGENTFDETEKKELLEELHTWKIKNCKLELEIQEEREELIKLQTEIEKLLTNHELIQSQNSEFRTNLSILSSENVKLQERVTKYNKLKTICKKLANDVNEMRQIINLTSMETKSFTQINKEMFSSLIKEMKIIINTVLQKEVESLKAKYNNLKLDHTALQNELSNISKKYEDIFRDFNISQDENSKLKSSLEQYQSDEILNSDKIKLKTDQYKVALDELNCLKNENHNLYSQIEKIENQSQYLQATNEKYKVDYPALVEQVKLLKNDKQDLITQLKIFENKNILLTKELELIHSQQKDVIVKLDMLNQENEQLQNKSKDLETITIYRNELEETVRVLSQENISLKTQTESIAYNVKKLQSEINDVRKSHAAIETEKKRLNQVIENLESRERKSNTDREINKYTQTSEDLLHFEDEPLYEESTEVVVKKTTIENFNDADAHIDSRSEEKDMAKKYSLMKIDLDSLREEKRRLQSDIEGLQTYLAKISKENCALNDKLREYIATSEHSPDNDDLSTDVRVLKNEVQLGKEKMDDLLRENTLLIEENLELKDQLHSQNYTKSGEFNSICNNDNELKIKTNDKTYNDLLQANNELEQKNDDLGQINNSVSGNMLQTQEKNEKLRLTNEKLERRLDEALVSLRHLHSLQENTELEYLRNILYEYLTGTGSHSVTLAKVLSAIVKFDDTQTQMVLQKEKERQGLLRQLGII